MNPTTTAAEVAANFHQPTAPAGLIVLLGAVLLIGGFFTLLTRPAPRQEPACDDCGTKGEPLYPVNIPRIHVCGHCVATRAAREAA